VILQRVEKSACVLARSLQQWIVEWKRHEGMDAAEELVEILGGTDDVVRELVTIL
jgi:hypothetical protein